MSTTTPSPSPRPAVAGFPRIKTPRLSGWLLITLALTASMPLFGTASVIVCGDTTPHLKPHPAPLEEARRQLGLHASQCIYVGDDERDMQAGRAAGMRTVAARYGYLGAGACADDWVCDAAIDHPLELLKWLGCP